MRSILDECLQFRTQDFTNRDSIRWSWIKYEKCNLPHASNEFFAAHTWILDSRDRSSFIVSFCVRYKWYALSISLPPSASLSHLHIFDTKLNSTFFFRRTLEPLALHNDVRIYVMLFIHLLHFFRSASVELIRFIPFFSCASRSQWYLCLSASSVSPPLFSRQRKNNLFTASEENKEEALWDEKKAKEKHFWDVECLLSQRALLHYGAVQLEDFFWKFINI